MGCFCGCLVGDDPFGFCLRLDCPLTTPIPPLSAPGRRLISAIGRPMFCMNVRPVSAARSGQLNDGYVGDRRLSFNTTQVMTASYNFSCGRSLSAHGPLPDLTLWKVVDR